MICCVHTAFLNRINGRVDVAATAVEIGCMHMDNQGFSADLFGKHTCRIGQPVVTVNDIEIQTVRQN